MSHLRNDVDELLLLLSGDNMKKVSDKLLKMRTTYNLDSIIEELKKFERARTHLIEYAIRLFEGVGK